MRTALAPLHHAFIVAVGLFAAAFGTPAFAAPVFLDDFESGALTGTGGRWDSRYQACSTSDCSMTATSSAARRGSFGFRMTDNNGASGARVEGQIDKDIPAHSAYYVRYWFRVASSSAQGGLIVSQVCLSNCSAGLSDAYLLDDRTIGASGTTGSGYSYTPSSPAFRLAIGTWYLVEHAANDIGSSTNGRRRTWVNGQLVAETTGLNFSNKTAAVFVLGQPWSAASGATSGTFRGNLDFDDVVVDSKPLPSRFDIQAPSSLNTGQCAAVTVQLRDSVSNSLAPAPYNITGVGFTLSGTASGTLFTDSGCTSSTSTLGISTDATSRTYYVKPTTSGTLTLNAGTASDDFLPAQRSISVSVSTSPNGAACSQNSQCSSGFCVDGVCCNSACNGGSCDACSAALGATTDGTCTLLPAGTVCRSVSNTCDRVEVCSGTSGACPSDGFQPSGTVCRAATDACDRAESCTGTSASCPADSLQASGTLCRSAADVCDRPESCTGTSKACPADGRQPSGTVCREASGTCDRAEVCNGTSVSCPSNGFLAAGTVCRDAGGTCDLQETCSGASPDCPGDNFRIAGTICRDAAGVCDVSESCSGTSATCPDDAFAPSTLMCSEETSSHQATYCSGTSVTCPASAPKTPEAPGGEPPLGEEPTTPGTGIDDPSAPNQPSPMPPSPPTPTDSSGTPLTDTPGSDTSTRPEAGTNQACAPGETDCIQQANLGFSCASAGGGEGLMLLPALALLLARRSGKRRSPLS